LHRSLAQATCPFETYIATDRTANGSIVLVCEVSEAIAGYLCVGDPHLMLDPTTPGPPAGVAFPWWKLRALGVAPQYRRTGVATDLWRAALDRIPDVITNLYGNVRLDQDAAVSWYRARGFDLDPVFRVTAPALTDRRVLFAPSSSREVHFHADIATLRANLQSPRASLTRSPHRELYPYGV